MNFHIIWLWFLATVLPIFLNPVRSLLKKITKAVFSKILKFVIMNLQRLFLVMLLPTLKEVGEQELDSCFTAFKEANDASALAELLKSVHSTFSLLLPVVSRTATKIDDTVVSLVIEAAQRRALSEGISLT
jgi:hypothetical protein